MKNLKYLWTLILLFSAMLPAASQTEDNLSEYLFISDITEAAPPQFFQDSIVLSYQTDHPVRFIGAAFSHEDYRMIHPYEYNDRGVFVLIIPKPQNLEEIRYRIVVDGLWMTDPFNTVQRRDSSGIALSVIPLPRPLQQDEEAGPALLEDGRVRFTFRAERNSRITITGDFNNWDPFMHRLTEVSPGLYTITLRMLPGNYRYYFFYEGNRIPDPQNTARGTAPDGFDVSSIFVPPLS